MRLTIFYVSNLFIYFIFNLFIVDKFILVTTRIAFHKEQGLSKTPGAVNKITECWYCWYKIFETKSPLAVLIKVNLKQNKTKKTPYAANWQMTLYHNELIKIHRGWYRPFWTLVYQFWGHLIWAPKLHNVLQEVSFFHSSK